MFNCEDFDSLLNPRSVAIIGASCTRGFYWVRSFLEYGFPGKIFPVNPKEKEVLGLKCYPSILDVPEEVDFAIIAVPAPIVPKVLEDCAKKGIKLATVFSSGFSETGTREGALLEKRVAEVAKKVGVRIFGPNCMGVYFPKRGLSFRPDLPKESGDIGFISQSGGNAIGIVMCGSVWGLKFSKVFSYGNAADLDSPDLLEYLRWDEETQVIGLYIEGVKDGSRFLSVLRRTTEEKPVVVWKGGVTELGSRAVASHTGALAGSAQIWESVLKQANAVSVHSLEEMIDVLCGFSFLPPPKGKDLGIVSISGGSSVVCTDVAAQFGFNVPELPRKVQEKIYSMIQPVGVSVKNPIDLASSFFNVDAVKFALREVINYVDAFIFDFQVHYLILREHFGERGIVEKMVKIAIDISHEYLSAGKPFLIVLPLTYYSKEWLKSKEKFLNAKIPVFTSIIRAANALSKIYSFYQRRKQHD